MSAVAILPSFTEPAYSLDFKCVEISRYRNLLQIFKDDPAAFSSYFGLDQKQLPDPDMCRALVVTGNIQTGDAEALVDLINRSKGWLATLYLSFDSTDPVETLRVSQVVRGFWLKTRTLGSAPFRYEPDFVSDQVLGTEASDAEAAASDLVPVMKGLRAFSARRDLLVEIDPCRNQCDGSCPALWAAGASRLAEPPQIQTGTLAPPPSPDRPNSARTAPAENPGQLVPSAHRADVFSLPAMPGPMKEYLQQECVAEVAAVKGIEARLGADVDSFSRALLRSPLPEQIEDEIRSMRAAEARLQRCAAGVQERSRLESFARFCGANCDPKSALIKLAKDLPVMPAVADALKVANGATSGEIDGTSGVAPDRFVYRGASNKGTGEFVRTSTQQWVETTIDKIKHQFCSVTESSAAVVLYDGSRAAYVRASIPQRKIFYLPAGERNWRALYDIVDLPR